MFLYYLIILKLCTKIAFTFFTTLNAENRYVKCGINNNTTCFVKLIDNVSGCNIKKYCLFLSIRK